MCGGMIFYPDSILGFLFDHINKAGDLQARVKWEPGTVVLWDNRVTAHVSPTQETLRNVLHTEFWR